MRFQARPSTAARESAPPGNRSGRLRGHGRVSGTRSHDHRAPIKSPDRCLVQTQSMSLKPEDGNEVRDVRRDHAPRTNAVQKGRRQRTSLPVDNRGPDRCYTAGSGSCRPMKPRASRSTHVSRARSGESNATRNREPSRAASTPRFASPNEMDADLLKSLAAATLSGVAPDASTSISRPGRRCGSPVAS